MNYKSLSFLVGALTCMGSSALAVNNPAKMTCKDFIALDEVSRPKAYYWAEGYNRFGEEDAVIDFDRQDRLIPMLVEECTKTPSHALIKKVKEVHKKVASN